MVHIIIVLKDEPRTPSEPGENITKRDFFMVKTNKQVMNRV